MSRASSAILRSIIARSARTSDGRRGSSRSEVAVISTGISGVRNSWESAARKLSLARARDFRSLLLRHEVCFRGAALDVACDRIGNRRQIAENCIGEGMAGEKSQHADHPPFRD